jgi:hypothetical protein
MVGVPETAGLTGVAVGGGAIFSKEVLQGGICVAARDEELWSKIRQDYVSSGKSYRQLAEEYGVNLNSVKRYGTREGWKAERDQKTITATAKAAEIATGEPITSEITAITEPVKGEILSGAEREQRFLAVTDALMERIFEAVEGADTRYMSAQSIKFLTSALHDIWEMQKLNRTALDREEQQARIAKLRSETKAQETVEHQGIVVEFVDTFGAET